MPYYCDAEGNVKQFPHDACEVHERIFRLPRTHERLLRGDQPNDPITVESEIKVWRRVWAREDV